MSTKLTPGRAVLLSTTLLLLAPGCSLEDFDVDGDGQVTRAEALYAGFLWLAEEITPGDENPEEPTPEEPTPEEPTPEEPLPEEPTPQTPDDGLTPTVPDPNDPLAPF
jgi:hypothetical protein